MKEQKEAVTLKQRILKIFSVKNIIGIVVGLVGGYVYYRTVGCSTGSCPITGNPWLMTVWGGLAGYLIADMIPFKKKKPADDKTEL
jgi:hypothetical protein